ncbi:MAG: mdeA 2 [Candidatus Aminicenantes bacterium]|nr:mdeA 2 [Candidatus Aminicenantes bacterium]
MTTKRRFATLAIHGNESNRGKSEPVSFPIYHSSTYIFPSSDAIEGYMKRGERKQHIYVRDGNPTEDQLNRRLALLEGAEDALVCGSGMAAITTAILSAVRPGDEIIALPTLYGQTLNFLRHSLPEGHGVQVKFVAGVEGLYDLNSFVGPKSRLVYFETPTNPNLQVVDIARVVEQARKFGLMTMLDNTFATPINQRPIPMGVDAIIHSATKYLGGHSDVLAGVIAGTKEFIHECHERIYQYGPVLSPFSSFLLLRSLKTLQIRVERQNANALALARFFREHERIEKVYYPGLPDDPFHETAKKQMHGFGGIVTVVLRGDKADAMNFVDRLEICLNATSLGGVETLVSLPVIASHAWQSDEELAQAKILPQMVRFSVGLEDIDDLISDCRQALG